MSAGVIVRLRLFARAREAAGAPVLEVTLPPGATTGDALEALPGHVRAHVDPACTRIAVNGEWCGAERPLAPGDEVALITPVSGG